MDYSQICMVELRCAILLADFKRVVSVLKCANYRQCLSSIELFSVEMVEDDIDVFNLPIVGEDLLMQAAHYLNLKVKAVPAISYSYKNYEKRGCRKKIFITL